MAKFSVGSFEEGEGSSSRNQKRRRMDRQPQPDSIETVVEEVYDGDEETGSIDQDYELYLSNQEATLEDEQEQDAGSGEEEEAVNNPVDEEMDEPAVEPGKNESVSVTLTDPEVFDCPICCNPLSAPVFQVCFFPPSSVFYHLGSFFVQNESLGLFLFSHFYLLRN